MSVKAWQEDVIIPTYEIGKAEKNPIFLEKRVYQGSSGSVYPYPVVEKIEDTKKDKTYKAVYIENEYIKIIINLYRLQPPCVVSLLKFQQRMIISLS